MESFIEYNHLTQCKLSSRRPKERRKQNRLDHLVALRRKMYLQRKKCHQHRKTPQQIPRLLILTPASKTLLAPFRTLQMKASKHLQQVQKLRRVGSKSAVQDFDHKLPRRFFSCQVLLSQFSNLRKQKRRRQRLTRRIVRINRSRKQIDNVVSILKAALQCLK